MTLRTDALWESASPGKLRHAPRVDSLATAHEKGQPQSTGLSRVTENSGGRIRTYDLRVMSPTSYQTALPRSCGADYSCGCRGVQGAAAPPPN